MTLLIDIIRTGIGMDASVTPLRHGGLSLVQTTDFFYPLVDDPYMMGKLRSIQFQYPFSHHISCLKIGQVLKYLFFNYFSKYLEECYD